MFPLEKQGKKKVSFSVQNSTGSVCVCVCVCLKKGVRAAGCQRCAINLYKHPHSHYRAKRGQLGLSLLTLLCNSHPKSDFCLFCTLLFDRDHYSATSRCQGNKYCSRAGGANMSRRSGPRLALLVEKWLLSHAWVGLGAEGRGQSLLLLLQSRPKIGEPGGHDTKTGFMCRVLRFMCVCFL